MAASKYTPCPYDEGEDNHPQGIDGKPCPLCRAYFRRLKGRSISWILQRKARTARWSNLCGTVEEDRGTRGRAKVIQLHGKRA